MYSVLASKCLLAVFAGCICVCCCPKDSMSRHVCPSLSKSGKHEYPKSTILLLKDGTPVLCLCSEPFLDGVSPIVLLPPCLVLIFQPQVGCSQDAQPKGC